MSNIGRMRSFFKVVLYSLFYRTLHIVVDHLKLLKSAYECLSECFYCKFVDGQQEVSVNAK